LARAESLSAMASKLFLKYERSCIPSMLTHGVEGLFLFFLHFDGFQVFSLEDLPAI
jgi:hypothetical protein